MKKIGMALVAALAMAACQSHTDKTNDKAAADKEAKPAMNNSEPVELVFYSHAGNSEDFFNTMFREPLQKKFPNMTVKYVIKGTGTTLPELLAAGQKVDVYVDAAGIYHQLKDLKVETDLTELIRKHDIDLHAFEPEGPKQMTLDGKPYGLPLFAQTLVTYYNIDLFNQYGVPLPKDGMTWDEAIEIGRRMTRSEQGKQMIGLWVNPKPYIRQNQHSLALIQTNPYRADLSGDKWKTLMDAVFMKPAADPGVKASLEKGFPGHADFYTSQRIGMYVMLNDLYFRGYEPMQKMNWNMVSIPAFQEAPGIRSQDVYVGLFPLSVSDKKDWAMEAIQYLTSEEHQMYLSGRGYMTALKSEAVKKAMGKDTAFKDKNFYGALFSQKPAPSIQTTPYDDLLVENALDQTNLKELQKGYIDLNTALRQAEEAANKAVAAELSKK